MRLKDRIRNWPRPLRLTIRMLFAVLLGCLVFGLGSYYWVGNRALKADLLAGALFGFVIFVAQDIVLPILERWVTARLRHRKPGERSS